MITFLAPPLGEPNPPMLQAMATVIMSILPSSMSSGPSPDWLPRWRMMAMGRKMAASAWSEMNEAAGAMTRIITT